jgi:hypothetical protein
MPEKRFGDLHLDAVAMTQGVPARERECARTELLRKAAGLPDGYERELALCGAIALAARMIGSDPYQDLAAFVASEYDGRAIKLGDTPAAQGR